MAMPWTLRWPIEYTMFRDPPMTGLSLGAPPSRVMRRIFPFRLARLCGNVWLLASPMLTHRRPLRSISTAHPLWIVAARMLPTRIFSPPQEPSPRIE